MSHVTTRPFKIGLALSVVVGVASVVAAAWAATAAPVMYLDGGVPIGNKQLTGYRQGLDFRVVTYSDLEVFVFPERSPTANTRAAAALNAAWGRPRHWLNVPEFSLSLWWPAALSAVLPSIWLLRARKRQPAGFPVLPGRRATREHPAVDRLAPRSA